MGKTVEFKPTEQELEKLKAERTAAENLENFAKGYDALCKEFGYILTPDFSAPINKMGVVPRAVKFEQEGAE